MYSNPYSNSPDALGVLVLVIAPAVFLLCLLFNVYKLGKFKHVKWSLSAPENRHFLLFLISVFVVLLILFIRSFF